MRLLVLFIVLLIGSPAIGQQLSIERKITVGSSLWHRLPARDLTSTGWKPMPLIFRTMLKAISTGWYVVSSTDF